MSDGRNTNLNIDNIPRERLLDLTKRYFSEPLSIVLTDNHVHRVAIKEVKYLLRVVYGYRLRFTEQGGVDRRTYGAKLSKNECFLLVKVEIPPIHTDRDEALWALMCKCHNVLWGEPDFLRLDPPSYSAGEYAEREAHESERRC
jgi:hypothetical protein